MSQADSPDLEFYRTATRELIATQRAKLRVNSGLATTSFLIGVAIAGWSFLTGDGDLAQRITELGGAVLAAISSVPATKLLAARSKLNALRTLDSGFTRLAQADAGSSQLLDHLQERFYKVFDSELAIA